MVTQTGYARTIYWHFKFLLVLNKLYNDWRDEIYEANLFVALFYWKLAVSLSSD